ncbi:hypothetical protein EG240_01585 [Paenimyroides tangerinum]|uniref:Uncharacterized protein n=1 Tax=Paenimyroides tangerinum TaxID=2488728 RepID=A0A3P3WC45_9FLAO|nr:hypothetical protein [Paenimyroides tangerinum]RRJ92735.1 hypothetical protein EG240_01585 [Paenimyroides tangerinum]
MAYVNIYQYDQFTSVEVKKFIYSGTSTYVVGKVRRGNEQVPEQMFIGKLDADGNYLWQRRYIYPDTQVTGGYVWAFPHFTDVVEIPGTKDIVVLGFDRDVALLMRLKENGDISWIKKIYDVQTVKPIYDNVNFNPCLHIFDDNSLVVHIRENHNKGAGPAQINHNIYRFDPEEGYEIQAIQIPTRSPMLLVREERMEKGLLTFYGGYAETGAIMQIDQNLNIVRSVGFFYTGPLKGYNSFHIYAASPVHEGRYTVMGSFYHYDPSAPVEDRIGLEWVINREIRFNFDVLELIKNFEKPVPRQYTNFFVAEINQEHDQIIAIGESDKDFAAVMQTVALNDYGTFCSVGSSLYQLDSGISHSQWTKAIQLPEMNNYHLGISEHTDNKITSFSYNLSTVAIAQSLPDYDTCRTIPVDEVLKFQPLETKWRELEFSVERISPEKYEEPRIEFYDLRSEKQQVICPPDDGGTGIIIDANTHLQSADIYLQAAGSTGEDSTAGIHLRWLLKNNLQTHLPKGDYYQGQPQGNNKPDDYVQIFRTPYKPVSLQLSFSQAPQSVVDAQALWLYSIGGKSIYVYFRNTTRYQQVRSAINPLNNPIGFLNEYGNNLIEVESPNHLFFGVRLTPSVGTGTVKAEIQSVETEQLNLPKNVTFRNNMSAVEMGRTVYAENGRSVRFAPFNCIVNAINFEFYLDFIQTANKGQAWQDMGKYSLTLEDEEAYKRLEPRPDERPVHAVWPRYNDGEFVNIKNYHVKWNGDLEDPRQRIKDSVERYLEMSNDPMNPLANEIYYLNDEPNEEMDNGLEISHLMMLQMASMDYHVARMLGLGILDLESEVYKGQQYIYVAQYFTFENGNSDVKSNHLYMSLPTSLDDQRLTLPVILKEPVPGIVSADSELDQGQTITDADGYAHDGKTRYISLFAEELKPDEPEDSPFYYSSEQFYMATFTYPVYVGIEYKRATEPEWQKPELPNDPAYLNVTDTGAESKNETVGIAIPEVGQPAFIHRETRSGVHTYSSYGVNWFSRAISTHTRWDVETKIVPNNNLLPPSSINALLIQEESPLFLTSQNEQQMLTQITNTDKTFIRLALEYDTVQDMISYQKAIDGQVLPDFNPLPDNEEVFADEMEIFFSPEVPEQLFGVVTSVTDFPGNPLISVIQSEPMVLASAGQTLYPTVDVVEIPFYIGGVLQIGGDDFIIHDIEIPSATPLLPKFHVLKKQIGDAFGENSNVPFDPADFITPATGVSFMFTRNMLNVDSWGAVNPNPFKVQIGNNWNIQQEEVTIEAGTGTDTTQNTYLRKFRGFVFNNASIKQYTDSYSPTFAGLYEITFPGYTIGNHPQFNPNVEELSVQWYRGSIRVPYQNNVNGERKTLKVIRFHEDAGNLIVYAQDENYDTAPLQTIAIRNNTWVNFYPGYRVYLYHNIPCRLTEGHILPQEEGILDKYSIFGMRSRVAGSIDFISPISTPTFMFARRFEKPQTPEQPKGALYATRPDYFGRSTYTFTTQYTHKPFSVAMCRSNDDILFSSLYLQTPYGEAPLPNSVEDIRIQNADDFANDRLLDFANATVDSGYLFPEHNGYRFPIPNSTAFFESINGFIAEHNSHYGDSVPFIAPNTLSNMNHIVIPGVPGRNEQLTFYDFVKQTVDNSYVPLTEVPMIYQYVKDGAYMPIPKAQTIRDRNGVLLKPTDADFDIAPMMKIVSTNPHKTLFTDFTLDGASTSVYFYAVRETDAQMKQGELSTAIGPVRLVNSYAVKTPEIKSVIPILENEILGISPAMQIEVNSYEAIHNVTKINLYRALNMGDATSVRAMTLVKTIDLETDGLLEEGIWTITDDFADLTEIPYGDALYYRVTVEAKVEYAEANYSYDDNNPNNVFTIVTDFAPSEPSKLMITMITENVIPDSPNLSYTATTVNPTTLGTVVFEWDKQVYKGKYYLHKMNEKGNWEQIAFIASNDAVIVLPLVDTDWGSDQLIIQDSEGNPVYHHFKMITENTAGMSSTDEIILTIPS